jgi:membrane protease YdiL (CAAX protease family)
MAIVGSCEELVYRGFLIWFLAPATGLVVAVLLSAAAFGFAHGYRGASGIVRTAGIGVAFGTAPAVTHSLWWLVVAHVIVNLFAVPLPRRLQHGVATQVAS